MIVGLTKYYLGEQIKKNDIGRGTWHIWWAGDVSTGFGGKI
jgi:hypothetical protein